MLHLGGQFCRFFAVSFAVSLVIHGEGTFFDSMEGNPMQILSLIDCVIDWIK